MTTFDRREEDFEARFKHDEDFRFKVTARSNRLAGLWAAGRMGLAGAAAETYAKSIVDAEFERGGDRYVVGKLVGDLAAKGVAVTAADIETEMARFVAQAKQQLMVE